MTEAFPISGNIDPRAFPFLVLELHRQGATGSLRVEGPTFPKALYFRGGRILFGSSNDPKDQLGSILIANGKITQEQLDEVNTKVGPGNPLAKILAESGFVNQRELGEAARVKVERILSDVIAYTSGSFEFEDGVLPKGAVDLKLSTEKLVLAAVMRLSDRGFVLRHLDSLGVLLEPTAELESKLPEIRTEAGGLPERLDGRHTLKEAASLTRLDEFDAAKVACALLFLGLVRRAEAPAVVTAEPAEGGEELDLAQTARMAFEEPGGSSGPGAETESAFFVSDEPPGEEIGVPAPGPDVSEASIESFPMPEVDEGAFAAAEPGPQDFAMAEPEPIVFSPEEADAGAGPEVVVPSASAEETTAFIMPSPEPSPAAPHPAFGLETIPEGIPTIGSSAPSPAAAFPPAPSPPIPSLPSPPPPDVPSFKVTRPPPPAFHFDAEEENRADTLPPSRPSKEDLAALDELLNPSASRGPAQPLGRAKAERWEPQFRPQPVSRRAARREVPAVLLYGLPALLLVGVGLGAWYHFALPAPPHHPATAPVTTMATLPPTTAAPPPTTVASSLAPTPTTAPPVTPSATPATVATPRPPPPATPAPGRAGEGTMAEAHSLLRKGSYAQAAQSFAALLRGSRDARYSVQVLVACSTETVQKALENVPGEDLFILPVSYKGRSCYRLGWGLYDSEDRANAALRSLPEYFRKGGATPKVAPTAGMLP